MTTDKGGTQTDKALAASLAGAVSLQELDTGGGAGASGGGGGGGGSSAISAALLELAGEGKLPLTAALLAWQRDQDRVANRAWRRPGGMARMGLV